MGDLGNVDEDDNGAVNTDITDSVISLFGNYSIIGRSVVVSGLASVIHQGPISRTDLS